MTPNYYYLTRGGLLPARISEMTEAVALVALIRDPARLATTLAEATRHEATQLRPRYEGERLQSVRRTLDWAASGLRKS